MGLDLAALKLALLVFWGAWFVLLFSSNLLAVLRAVHVLPPGEAGRQERYRAACLACERLQLPGWMPLLLFYALLIWQLLAATFFIIALSHALVRGVLDMSAIHAAFTIACGHSLALVLADEAFAQARRQPVHLLLVLTQLVSLLCLHLLPA